MFLYDIDINIKTRFQCAHLYFWLTYRGWSWKRNWTKIKQLFPDHSNADKCVLTWKNKGIAQNMYVKGKVVSAHAHKNSHTQHELKMHKYPVILNTKAYKYVKSIS